MLVWESVGLGACRAARESVFRLIAYATLLFDAYLVLAGIAILRMKAEYHHYLPPLGWPEAEGIPRMFTLFIVGWTALLAVGCLWCPKRVGKPE